MSASTPATTLIGPLTTAFVPPTDCDLLSLVRGTTTDAYSYYYIVQYVPGYESGTRCFPPGATTSRGFYSPGICPSGWTFQATTNGLEKTHNCCPPSLPTISFCDSPDCAYIGVQCSGSATLTTPTKVAVYGQGTFSYFTTTTLLPAAAALYHNTVGGLGIQVRFKDADFATAASSTAASPTAPSTAATSTNATTETSTSDLPIGAKIGIGVGVSLLAILICVVAFLILLRRRRRKAVSSTTDTHGETLRTNGKAELPGSTGDAANFNGAPLYEKSELPATIQDLQSTLEVDHSLMRRDPAVPELPVNRVNVKAGSAAELTAEHGIQASFPTSPEALAAVTAELSNTNDIRPTTETLNSGTNQGELHHATTPGELTQPPAPAVPSSTYHASSGPLPSVEELYPSPASALGDEDLAYQERRLRERRALLAEKERLAAEKERLAADEDLLREKVVRARQRKAE